MKKIKVLVLGAYGMLGHKLLERLSKSHDVFSTCRHFHTGLRWFPQVDTGRILPGVDAFQFESVASVLQSLKPDVVINALGIIKQLDTAHDPLPCIQMNALFPHQLAALCKQVNARMIHFSTDCVFSGKQGNYQETDISDAVDLYGRTKFLGEVNTDGCLTLRTSIIGPELASAVGLFEWFYSQRGKRVKGYQKAVYTGFSTLEMSRIVEMLIREQPALSGVWNVASAPISKYELLCLLNSQMGLEITVEPDHHMICDRSLSGEAFSKRTGYRAPAWEMMISEMLGDVEIANRPHRGQNG